MRYPKIVLKRLERFVDHDLDYDRIKSIAIGSVAVPNTVFKDGRSPIGRWQTDFSPSELSRFESLTGDKLKELDTRLPALFLKVGNS